MNKVQFIIGNDAKRKKEFFINDNSIILKGVIPSKILLLKRGMLQQMIFIHMNFGLEFC